MLIDTLHMHGLTMVDSLPSYHNYIASYMVLLYNYIIYIGTFFIQLIDNLNIYVNVHVGKIFVSM